jgi:vitamin B12 transporter
MNKKLSTSLVASFLLATNLLSNELDQITVTSATKSEQSIKDVTSNVEVITKEDIEERHFVTIADALNTLAGVSFVSNGSLGNTTSVFLRGMDTQRILVLIDGVRYQDPSNTSGAAFSDLMINDIEKIEVIKGAQSGIWGADAAAGVINIITKDTKIGTNISTNLEIGSFMTKKYGLSVSNKTKLYDVKVSANRVITDGFSAQAVYGKNLGQYEDDGYRNTTINAKAGLNISDNDRLTLNVNHINSFVEYDSFSAPDSIQRTDNESVLYSVSYNKNISNHSIKLNHDISDFQKENLDATFGVKIYNGKTYVTELVDNISYAKNSNLIIGASYEEYKADYITTTSTTNEESNSNKAVYLTNINNFDKFIFTQSLRRDDYSNFGSKVTGKIGAKYFITNDLSVNGNYGTAYNAPNIIQMLNPWGASNLDLKPEQTKSYDLTLEYKSISLTYFNNDVKDLISWDSTINGYNNTPGTSKIKGYEAKYSKDILKDTLLSLNYTHLSAKNASGQDLGRRPKNQIGLNLDYYGINKLHFNTNATYIGTRYDFNNKGGRQTGKYTVWNAVINYDINKDYRVYFKLDNIFDKDYQTIDGYATAPRSGYVGLEAKF